MQFTQRFLWVLYNVFLALVPVALAYFFSWLAGAKFPFRKPAMVIVGLVWIVFVPNTCYLITEWRHFLETLGYTNLPSTWQWDMDSRILLMGLTLFYVCYSGAGVFAFALSVRPMVRLLKNWELRPWLWGIPFFILVSMGVYLGLIHRFNSWNILDQFGTIWATVLELGHRPELFSFIVLFAGVLWLVYLFADIWIDGFVHRFKKRG